MSEIDPAVISCAVEKALEWFDRGDHNTSRRPDWERYYRKVCERDWEDRHVVGESIYKIYDEFLYMRSISLASRDDYVDGLKYVHHTRRYTFGPDKDREYASFFTAWRTMNPGVDYSHDHLYEQLLQAAPVSKATGLPGQETKERPDIQSEAFAPPTDFALHVEDL